MMMSKNGEKTGIGMMHSNSTITAPTGGQSTRAHRRRLRAMPPGFAALALAATGGASATASPPTDAASSITTSGGSMGCVGAFNIAAAHGARMHHWREEKQHEQTALLSSIQRLRERRGKGFINDSTGPLHVLSTITHLQVSKMPKRMVLEEHKRDASQILASGQVGVSEPLSRGVSAGSL
jgi:hypothetical protein